MMEIVLIDQDLANCENGVSTKLERQILAHVS